MSLAAFTIKAARFEGPLELLFSLIQERKLSINEIALAEVTDAYLAYLQDAAAHPISETTQFVYIAATLLLIKSRSLLPAMELTEEEEHDIDELERRLALYRIIRLAAARIGKQWRTAPLCSSGYRPAAQVRFEPGSLSLAQLEGAIHHLIAEFPTSIFRPTVHVEATLSLEEVVDRLRARIVGASRILFSELKRGGSRADVIIRFLALLELVKGGIATAEQSGSFDDIVVATDSFGVPRYE